MSSQARSIVGRGGGGGGVACYVTPGLDYEYRKREREKEAENSEREQVKRKQYPMLKRQDGASVHPFIPEAGVSLGVRRLFSVPLPAPPRSPSWPRASQSSSSGSHFVLVRKVISDIVKEGCRTSTIVAVRQYTDYLG